FIYLCCYVFGLSIFFLFLHFLFLFYFFFFFLMIRRPPRSTLFPSRRSSDLVELGMERLVRRVVGGFDLAIHRRLDRLFDRVDQSDRKSTRLNSSHDQISYAVFCLKKKKKKLKINKT